MKEILKNRGCYWGAVTGCIPTFRRQTLKPTRLLAGGCLLEEMIPKKLPTVNAVLRNLDKNRRVILELKVSGPGF